MVNACWLQYFCIAINKLIAKVYYVYSHTLDAIAVIIECITTLVIISTTYVCHRCGCGAVTQRQPDRGGRPKREPSDTLLPRHAVTSSHRFCYSVAKTRGRLGEFGHLVNCVLPPSSDNRLRSLATITQLRSS